MRRATQFKNDSPTSPTTPSQESEKLVKKQLFSRAARKKLFGACRSALLHKRVSVRVSALRILRYSLFEEGDINVCVALGVDLLISLALMQKENAEVVEAIKFVWKMLQVSPNKIYSPAIVRSLAAIAVTSSNTEPEFADGLRVICLETLRRMAVADVRFVSQCGALDPLWKAALDPNTQPSIAEPIMITIVHLLINRQVRSHLRQNLDLGALLSSFTDMNSKGRPSTNHALATIMKTWGGVWLVGSEPKGLKALINVLDSGAPVSANMKLNILDAFIGVFRNVLHCDLSSDEGVSDSVAEKQLRQPLSQQDQRWSAQHDVMESFTVTILLACIHCGFVEVLSKLSVDSSQNIAWPARHLLTGFLKLSGRLLPERLHARMLTLPSLVAAASGSTTLNENLADLSEATATLEAIDPVKGWNTHGVQEVASMLITVYNDNHAPNDPRYLRLSVQDKHDFSDDFIPLHDDKGSAKKVTSSHELTRKKSVLTKNFLGASSSFNAEYDLHQLILRCNVQNTNDWDAWDWKAIASVLPVVRHLGPGAFRDCLKQPFLIKLGFFFNGHYKKNVRRVFLGLPWTNENLRLGYCLRQWILAMAANPDGRDKMKKGQKCGVVAAIRELLKRETPKTAAGNKRAAGERVFTRKGCIYTMTRELMQCLGIVFKLQADASGKKRDTLPFGEQNVRKIRQYLTQLDSSNEYLVRLVMASLDYTQVDQRDLFQVWMSSDVYSESLRIYGVSLLRDILIVDRPPDREIVRWAVEILHSFSHRPESRLAQFVITVLEEASAHNHDYLITYLSLGPSLSAILHIGTKKAQDLVMRFLSVPLGIGRVIESGDWLQQTLAVWRKTGYTRYISEVDSLLCHVIDKASSQNQNQSARRIDTWSEEHVLRSITPIPILDPCNKFLGTESSKDSELYWKYRLPWAVKLFISIPNPTDGGLSTKEIEVNCDCYMDTSTRDPQTGERKFLVRARALGSTFTPQAQWIPPGGSLKAHLFVGSHYIFRDGCVPNGTPSPAVHRSQMSTTDAVAIKIVSRTGVEGMRMPEWEICSPADMEEALQPGRASADGKVSIPGQACVWNFVQEQESETGPKKRMNRKSSRKYIERLTSVNREAAKMNPLRLESLVFEVAVLPSVAARALSPLHFYSQLVQTSRGCANLRRSEHIDEFLKEAFHKKDELPLARRGSLMALAHIGTCDNGFHLLMEKDPNILDRFLDLLHDPEQVGLRGTAFMAIGLFCNSPTAKQQLSKRGWESTWHPRGGCTVAVPSRLNKLFATAATAAPVNRVKIPPMPNNLPAVTDSKSLEVFRHICNLSCSVPRKQSLAWLRRAYGTERYRPVFEQPENLVRVLHILARYPLPLAERQIVLFKLFKHALYTCKLWTPSLMDSILVSDRE